MPTKTIAIKIVFTLKSVIYGVKPLNLVQIYKSFLTSQQFCVPLGDFNNDNINSNL